MLGLFEFFRDLWRQRQRRLDLEILWPLCREKAKTLEGAKIAFALHAHNDPAWTCLGRDHIDQVIDALD
jgi:hypothetical protein